MKFGDFFKTAMTTSVVIGNKGLWGVRQPGVEVIDDVKGLDIELDNKGGNVKKFADPKDSKQTSVAAASGFISPMKDSYPSSNLWRMREIELSKKDEQLLGR